MLLHVLVQNTAAQLAERIVDMDWNMRIKIVLDAGRTHVEVLALSQDDTRKTRHVSIITRSEYFYNRFHLCRNISHIETYLT
jgi:hypothetical protein